MENDFIIDNFFIATGIEEKTKEESQNMKTPFLYKLLRENAKERNTR